MFIIIHQGMKINRQIPPASSVIYVNLDKGFRPKSYALDGDWSSGRFGLAWDAAVTAS